MTPHDLLGLGEQIATHNAARTKWANRLGDAIGAAAIVALAVWALVEYLTPCAQGSLC